MLARRIKTSLFYTLLFVLLISPSFILTGYSYSVLYAQITRQIFEERQALSRQSAETIIARLDAIRDVGIASAADISDEVADSDWEGAVEEISHVSKQFPYIDRIFLSDLAGHTTAYYPPSPENVNKDFSHRDWYKGVSKEWKPYVSEVFKRAPIPQYNTVAVMAPIKDNNDVPLGAVGFAVNVSSFGELSRKFNTGAGEFLYIVNQHGQLISHPKFNPHEELYDFSSIPVVQKLMQGKSGIEVSYNPIEKEDRLGAYTYIPGYNWGVVVTEPVDAAFGLRNETMQGLLRTFLFVIIINVVMALIMLYAFHRLRSSRNEMRKQSEELLYKDQLLAEAQQAGEVGSFTINLADNSIQISDETYRLYGLSPQDGQTNMVDFISLIHPEDRTKVTEAITSAANTGNAVDITYKVVWPDTSEHWIIAKGKTVVAAGVSKIIGTVHDVTRERQLEKLKDEFVSVASHELRTPMTAIKGFTSMILDGDYGEVPEKIKDPLQDVLSSTQRLINLVNDMLNISRIEQGRARFSLKEININTLVKETLSSITPIAVQKGLELKYVEDLSVKEVQADVDKVKQVLTNLIGNSLKFTDKGSITVTLIPEGDFIEVHVIDTGFGIDAKDASLLFGKFQQINSGKHSKVAGTGLGLYISRALIRKMGGDLWLAESVVGKGSTFVFTLPCVATEGAINAKKEILAEAEAHPNQKDLNTLETS